MNDVVEFAKRHGINKNSRILNITHIDLDGIVSTINLKNFFDDVFYVQLNYDKINQYFKNVIFEDKCTFKNPDFIFITDISIEEEVLKEAEKRGHVVVILDHHETAYHLNKYENCYVDEGDMLSGAGVTLEFIKKIGYNGEHLDKLNKIANEYDLFLFKKFPELRKFTVKGKKRSLAEMLNTLYFKFRNKDEFIGRWFDGWGDGFMQYEIDLIKQEQEEANKYLSGIVGNPSLEIKLADNKYLILKNYHIMSLGEYYLDEKQLDLLIMYDHKRQKFSGRVNDKANINIGKIFQMLNTKYDFVSNGGGHEKAGGGNITSNDHLEKFVDSVVKLCSYYE